MKKSALNRIISLLKKFWQKIRYSMNRHKYYQDLLDLGKAHLNTWYNYIQTPVGPHNMEPWFQHNSYTSPLLGEDFVEFTFLGVRYRLQLKINVDSGAGLLELWEMESTKSYEDGTKIWELSEHIKSMDVQYGLNSALGFVTARQGMEIRGKFIPVSIIHEMKNPFAKEFDKESESRDKTKN